MKEITVQELKNMQTNNEDFLFIDVREVHEYESANLGATHIPLSGIKSSLDDFEADPSKKVVVHCRSGKRSAQAIELVEDLQGYENLYNLKGGILAYKAEIDSTLDVE